MSDPLDLHARNEPLLTWETWRRRQARSWPSPVFEVDHLLDSQRRFRSMLDDGDVFYSRTDLRMFADNCRTEARTRLVEAYVRSTEGDAQGDGRGEEDVESLQDLVLHAAARLKVSPLNTMQLIEDYPHLVRKAHPEGSPDGSLPLHAAAAAVGSDHACRLRPFLNAYPAAIEHVDERGMLPMQIALVRGADLEVMKLLIDAFPQALERPLLPQGAPVPEDLAELAGLLPFQMACSRNYSLDVIFLLLVESPDNILGALHPH